MYKKQQWAHAENIAAHRLENNGRSIIERNWTMRWWEIDIIASKGEFVVCVEVKSVVVVDDIMAYITDKKMWHLKRAFKTYLHLHPSDLQPRIDVIFIKDDAVRESYENVTGT